MIRKILKPNFWRPTAWNGDTNLYQDQLGWDDASQADAHSSDSWNIFDFYLGHYGFDLALYLVPFDEFYYIDNIECNEVLKLKDRNDWDGQFIIDRVEISNYPENEPEVICEYNDTRELWKNLKIHDMSLKEVIDNSVVLLEH